MMDILLRRRQNNPILTGEAGVGKTAVVEGLAQKIIDGDVPPALQNVAIKSLDLAIDILWICVISWMCWRSMA